jgi:hypothetical protein
MIIINKGAADKRSAPYKIEDFSTAIVCSWGGQFFMAKTNKINKIKVICNSVMVITPILSAICG